MRTLDPIHHIQSRPEMYLPASGSIALFLAQRLSSDAMILGANAVALDHQGDWWTVAADKDWLIDDQHGDIADVFSKIIPFPEGGDNSMRSEILLTAFARDILTSDSSHMRVIKGKGMAPETASGLPVCFPYVRAVRFRV